MKVSGEYQIAASREDVWAALNDETMLRECIPGCETLEKVSDTEFEAKVKAAIGPVRATFNSRLSLEDLNPPTSYRLAGESKAGAAGFGRGAADVRLEDSGSGTLLRYDADIKVGGKLAQVGSRLVSGATKKTADEFFENFSKALDPGAARVAIEDVEIEEEEGIEAANAAMLLAKIGRIFVIAVVVVLLVWILVR